MDKSTRIRPTFSSTEAKKKSKKNKKINIIRNPFADPNSALDCQQPAVTTRPYRKDLFTDNRVLIGLRRSRSDDGKSNSDSSDEGEDEERMIKARREALAALDPTNRDPKAAEFRSSRSQPNGTLAATIDIQQVPRDMQELRTMQDDLKKSTALYTSPLFDQRKQHSGDSVPCTSKVYSANIPEIAISMATPSPPLSRNQDHLKSYPVAIDPSFLFPTSDSTLDSPHDVCRPTPEKTDSKSKDRSTTLYTKLFQRITTRPESVESRAFVISEDVQDHIGAAIDRDPGAWTPSHSTWSPRRNTFGTPTLQGNQQRKYQGRRNQRSKAHGYTLDPWDSDCDMLIHDEDADELDSPVSPSQPDTSLKGMVGGRRRSEDADATLVAKNLGTRSPFGRHEAEDWMMHPRTAAIRGTSHRVQNDAVAVPEKLPRPRSLGDEFITISLESPPHSSTTASESGNGATLSRTGSLDSSFHRLKKGASVFLMNIGSMSGPSDKSHIESRRVNGHSRETNTEQDDESSHRSSSTTFGIHRSLSSPPPALFTSFSSLRNLISTAAALGRSSTASGNEPSPPLSPSTCLRRSQTVSFGEHHDLSFGRVPSGQLSFSPASRRIYTPSMIPTIVIPQHSPDERSMPMAAMASYTPDSASSSVTMFSSNDGLGHKGHRYTSMDGQHGLLRVPEPARTVIRGQTSSAAMAAMSATSISRSRDDDTLNRSPTSISADSLAGPLMSDDYIGQFERERALARTKGTFATTSAMSLATTVHHSANQWATIKSVDFIEPSRNDNGVSDTEHTRTMSTGARKSRTCPLFKVVRGSRHGRSLSGQSDISEKLMQLPEPSRFEGMCSGRGFINITSMVLIMCGLVLLVLGYPIAASMRRDRLAEAAASATANNGTATGIHQVKFTMANSTTFSGGILSQEKTTTTRNVDVEHV